MGRAATVKSESVASIAAVCLGSSTVPAAVVIVVKHRACLSIGRLIVAVQAQSFVVIAGTVALSVCRWYVAVRC